MSFDFATSWAVDDTPLQTVCSNVESLDSKYGLPALRGENVQIAYRRGRRWRRKYVDSRVVPLAMWVNGNDPTTGVPNALGRRRQFHANMTALQQLLWTDGARQVELKKRWRDPTSGAVVFANALAEIVEGMQVNMDESACVAKCVVEFELADPYFYGALQSMQLAVNTPQTITVAGDAPTTKLGLTFTDQLANPQLTNSTNGIWVKLGSSIAAGDAVFLGVEDFVALRQSDDANLIGAVTRSGAREWMRLEPGANTIELEASSGTGTLTMEYAPAYL